jgi:hypothetical protein
MVSVAVTVLQPQLAFTEKFTCESAHNMLAIMLDPCYKGLECISKFVGPVQAKAVVADYNKYILPPLLQ